MRVGLITGNGKLGYSSVDYFFEEIERHFTARGSEVQRFDLAGGVVPLAEAEPDVTLGIGTQLFFVGEQPMWDALKIPHVAWVIDSPVPMDISQFRSPLLHYATIDRQHSDFLTSLGGDCTFIPLGTRTPERDLDTAREYDVIFTGHVGAVEAVREKWREHGAEAHTLLEQLLGPCLADLHTPLLTQIRRQLANRGLFEPADSAIVRTLYAALNEYLRAYKRVAVLEAIQESEVHIFGNCDEPSLRGKTNLQFHGPVPYQQTFELFRHAKVAINISPNYYDGSHDRAVVPISYGALSLTDDNRYLREHFGHQESMLFYRFDALDAIDPLLKSVLAEPELMRGMAERAAATVAEQFTWEQRCGQLHALCDTLAEKHSAHRVAPVEAQAIDILMDAAKSFRAGDASRGNVTVLKGFEKAAELLGSQSDPAFQERFADALRRTVEAQSHGKLAEVADLLEGDVVPLLRTRLES